MFDPASLGYAGMAFLAFILLFIFLAVRAGGTQRRSDTGPSLDFDLDSSEFGHLHPGHAHDAGGCKYDQEEERRTAAVPRPLIDTSNLSAPDARVVKALASVNAGEMRVMLNHLTGETPFNLGGVATQLVSRNSHNAGITTAARYMIEAYATAGITAKLWRYRARSKDFENVQLIIPGKKNPKKVLVLGAHLDSTAGRPWGNENKAPGAEDDGSGTTALYFAARAISELGGLDCTVHIVHFTGEEQGLWGSYAYADWLANEAKAQGLEVIGMIEMDMVGYCPNTKHRLDIHDEKDRNGSHSLVVEFVRQIERYKLNLAPFDTHNLGVKDRSDHAGFLDHGWRALLLSEEFTDAAFYPHYHTLRDTVDKINFDYLVEVCRAVIATSCEVGGLSQ